MRDIRGRGAEYVKYSEDFRQNLAELTAIALREGIVLASLKADTLYSVEAQAAAAMTGFNEELTAIDAVLLFQVATALAFERNNSRLALLLSATKRSQLEDHKKIVISAEAANHSLVHGNLLNSFMERFTEVASRGS